MMMPMMTCFAVVDVLAQSCSLPGSYSVDSMGDGHTSDDVDYGSTSDNDIQAMPALAINLDAHKQRVEMLKAKLKDLKQGRATPHLKKDSLAQKESGSLVEEQEVSASSHWDPARCSDGDMKEKKESAKKELVQTHLKKKPPRPRGSVKEAFNKCPVRPPPCPQPLVLWRKLEERRAAPTTTSAAPASDLTGFRKFFNSPRRDRSPSSLSVCTVASSPPHKRRKRRKKGRPLTLLPNTKYLDRLYLREQRRNYHRKR